MEPIAETPPVSSSSPSSTIQRTAGAESTLPVLMKFLELNWSRMSQLELQHEWKDQLIESLHREREELQRSSPQDVFVRERRLVVEYEGEAFEWLDLTEHEDALKDLSFVATMRENLAFYFNIPLAHLHVSDQAGPLVQDADFIRACQSLAPVLKVSDGRAAPAPPMQVRPFSAREFLTRNPGEPTAPEEPSVMPDLDFTPEHRPLPDAEDMQFRPWTTIQEPVTSTVRHLSYEPLSSGAFQGYSVPVYERGPDDAWEVMLSKGVGHTCFGFAITFETGGLGGLTVSSIQPGGVLARWNSMNPGSFVAVGCVIWAVNGIRSSPEAMQRELQTSQAVRLELRNQ